MKDSEARLEKVMEKQKQELLSIERKNLEEKVRIQRKFEQTIETIRKTARLEAQKGKF